MEQGQRPLMMTGDLFKRLNYNDKGRFDYECI